MCLTLFRMGRQKGFSTNIRLDPQNVLTFSFNPLATMLLNFKVIPSANPKLLNLNQDHPSKKAFFFWSNRYKIGVIIYLIEIL